MADFDCIILGAGISGVTAGRELRRAGFKVLILEAASRIGGRMRSMRDFVKHPGVDPAEFPVEAGAEYIHVTLQKRVVQEAKNKPLKVIKGRYKEFWAELDSGGFVPRPLKKIGSLFSPGHNRLFFPGWAKPKDLISAVLDDSDMCKVKKLFDAVRNAAPSLASVGEFVEASDFKQLGRVLARYTLTGHTPGSSSAVSVNGLAYDHIMDQLQDPTEFRIEDKNGRIVGYDALPERIRKQFEAGGNSSGAPGVVRLGAAVKRVQKRPDGTVEVFCRDAAGQEEVITARAALCTFSAGVLNPVTGSGDRIFGPLLPPAKRKALQIIKMGPITKFSLEFKKEVWGAPEMSVLSNPEGKARTFFSSFPKVQSTPPFVLTGLLMGVDHDWISHFPSDYHRAEALLAQVKEIFDPNGPTWQMEDFLVSRNGTGAFEPNFHRQSWSVDDPLTGGGNSFISVEAASADELRTARENLKSPLESLPVFWAGEATAPAYHEKYQPLCVHGAYMSGIEVGKDIAAFIEANADADIFRAYYQDKYEWLAGGAGFALTVAAEAARAGIEPLEFPIARPEKALLEVYRSALKLVTLDETAEYLLSEVLDARVELATVPEMKRAGKETTHPRAVAPKAATITVNLTPAQLNHLKLEADRITRRNVGKAAALFLSQLTRRHHLQKRRAVKTAKAIITRRKAAPRKTKLSKRPSRGAKKTSKRTRS